MRNGLENENHSQEPETLEIGIVPMLQIMFDKKRRCMFIPGALGLILFFGTSAYSLDRPFSRFNAAPGVFHITGVPESPASEETLPKENASGFSFVITRPSGPLHSPGRRPDAAANPYAVSPYSMFPASTQSFPLFVGNGAFSLSEYKGAISFASYLNSSKDNPAADEEEERVELEFSNRPELPQSDNAEWIRNKDASTFTRLKRAAWLSLSAHLVGMAYLEAKDAWHTGYHPFSNVGSNLRRAWTSAPVWDYDGFFDNFLGHPYAGAFNYNLMRSQNASAMVSWAYSCGQSFIWEYIIEATEEQPSIQDLISTSNVGALIGEGFHQLTRKMRKNGLSLKEKIIVLLINPGHVLNNGFH